MVVLDSDHAAAHVSAELKAYHGLVAVGGYLIVEDTNIKGTRCCRTSAPARLSRASSSRIPSSSSIRIGSTSC
jgi:cephalosporin hydroxylase